MILLVIENKGEGLEIWGCVSDSKMLLERHMNVWSWYGYLGPSLWYREYFDCIYNNHEIVLMQEGPVDGSQLRRRICLSWKPKRLDQNFSFAIGDP